MTANPNRAALSHTPIPPKSHCANTTRIDASPPNRLLISQQIPNANKSHQAPTQSLQPNQFAELKRSTATSRPTRTHGELSVTTWVAFRPVEVEICLE
ncbi:hypothetical protein RESH_05101 [Rhodopirellula europaea SH398]|uniref:Uncharacterized protein n=1 Tax=Rhodopirellula europaea SH398 TaxID=1263868 RepID=M5RYI9_9BACT|nr:hypothetical protein RESH_05101 [Rhodopirellula europaea SH398]